MITDFLTGAWTGGCIDLQTYSPYRRNLDYERDIEKNVWSGTGVGGTFRCWSRFRHLFCYLYRWKVCGQIPCFQRNQSPGAGTGTVRIPESSRDSVLPFFAEKHRRISDFRYPREAFSCPTVYRGKNVRLARSSRMAAEAISADAGKNPHGIERLSGLAGRYRGRLFSVHDDGTGVKVL